MRVVPQPKREMAAEGFPVGGHFFPKFMLTQDRAIRSNFVIVEWSPCGGVKLCDKLLS